MLSKRVVVVLCCLFALLCICSPSALFSQTPTSGVVTGTVIDPTGASVPGATITLEQASTGAKFTTTSSNTGHYIFPAVPPGNYTLVIEAKGFRRSVISKLPVEIDKSRTVDVKLEMGTTSEVIEVTAGTGALLQTTDASVGATLSGEALQRMPSQGRGAASLMFLQPAVTPDAPGGLGQMSGGGDLGGGQIAGARTEQVTFNIDGGDATSEMEGSNGYISPNSEPGAVSPNIPVPLEATEEFTVATSNPNATFGRSSGGQVSLITKEGTNTFHGSAYEYHIDDGLNANGWSNNRLNIHKPHLVDNRFGGRAGGPIWKNRLFFFGMYEGRRFYENAGFSRLVPTDTLKQGILRFQDCALGFDANGNCLGGNTVPYNLNPALGALTTGCNNAGGTVNGTPYAPGACDPRNIGISPVIASQLALYPTGNDTSIGDKLNTIGLTGNVEVPVITNLGILKVSFNLSSKWSGFVTEHYSKTDRTGADQVSILGTPKAVSGDPYYESYYTAQLQGQITPRFTAVTHGSYLRNWWAWIRTKPAPLVSGTDAALQLTGEGVASGDGSGKRLADPININTQQARPRIWNAHDWYIAEDLSWVHGSHTFQFGGAGYIWDIYHLRTDNVLGGLTVAPIYYVGARSPNGSQNSSVNIAGSFRPPQCAPATPTSPAVTTNCLQSSDISRWISLLPTVLGMVDHSAQDETRDGNFNPNPLGTGLFANTRIPSFTTYFQDVWKVRPSLTVTLGVSWGAQIVPSERDGKESVLVYADTGTPVNLQEYLQNRVNALGRGVTTTVDNNPPCTSPGVPAGCSATSGQVLSVNAYNPTFGLTPVNHLADPFKGKMRHTKWGDIGPRISAAWQVPFVNRVFGNHQTVIRGGYALLFDRTRAVNMVLTPLLSGGLVDVDKCAGPKFVFGSPGAAVCSNHRTNPTNAFRIGPDGSSLGCAGCGPGGIPAPTAKPIPFIPAAPFGLRQSYPYDPFNTPGYSHSFDLTVQRALPHNFLVEVGYIGRLSRNLPQAESFGAPYYLMKDAASGQTYAQAFDALAQQVRAGTFNASGTFTGTPPAFFENIIGTVNCQAAGFVNCADELAQNDAGDLIFGDLNSLSEFEMNFDTANFMDNMQFLFTSMVTDRGFSDYHAGFASVKKSYSNGLQFQADWTWSHAIGSQGFGQQYVYSNNSPYNYKIDKSSEVFDHRHVVHLSWYYDLPFGKGKQFSTHSGVFDRIIGGWSNSGIWSWYSGLPACIIADGDYGSFFSDGTCAIPSKGLPSITGFHRAPGSGGIGTNGDPTCPGPCGSGLNVFGDPAAVFNSVSRPLLSVQGRVPFDQLRSPRFWNLDLSLHKNIAATERFRMLLTADAFNVFNHVIFSVPSLDLAASQDFGVINSQANAPRSMQLGLRFEF